jgi:type I restriction enzyme S subunit
MNQLAATFPLGSITTWLSGGTPDRNNPSYWRGTIPWISAASLKRTLIRDSDQRVTEAGVRAGSRLAPVGATLVLVRGMALHRETRIGLAVRPVSFNQDVKALVPRAGVLPEFLVYSIQARARQILDLVSAAGSGTGVLDTGLLKRLPVWLPSFDEQCRVAEVIRDLDELTAKLEQMIAKKHAIKQGMMQQLLTGKIRLPGFTKPWELKRLGDLLAYEQPGRYLVSSTEYGDVGTPVLTAGKTFVLGRTTERYGIYDAVPVIIFDDFTTASKIVTFPFKAKSSAMKILSARSGVNLRYTYERMQLIDYPVVDHKRRWIAEYSKIEVEVPDDVEQRAIASVIDDSDAEVNALEARVSKARAIKAGMMQQLLTGRTRLPVKDGAA